MSSMGPQFGNGRLDAIEVKGPMTLTDTSMPCLALQWSPVPVAGETQNVQRTIGKVTIAPTGAVGSKLKITLTVERRNFSGDDLADLTYAISGAAAKVAWSSTDFTASRTASAATIKDVIDLINQLPGFKCWALHVPHSKSVNSDDFIALAETSVKSNVGVDGRSEVLYRDVSEDAVAYMRVSLPEERDANAFDLMQIRGKATGVTNGTLRLLRDNYAEYGDGSVEGEVYVEAVLAAAQTEYVDATKENAQTIRGPVLLEVTSDDLTVANYKVGIVQRTLGA